MRLMILALTVAMLFAAPVSAQNMLADPGFESGGLAGWIPFGNAQFQLGDGVQFVPNSGNYLCTMFGPFAGMFGVSGMFQSFPCNPGDQFEMDCFSRHSSLDAMIGGGAPMSNWAIMKIAFFDAMGNELLSAGVEATVVDGTMPTDTWFDNTPIMGTAPMGAVSVQALLLFLQPGNDGGAAHFDDASFVAVGVTPPTWPGSQDDLTVATGVNGAPLSSGGMDDDKNVFGGDVFQINVASPGGVYDLLPYSIIGEIYTTGTSTGSVAGFPELHFNLTGSLFILVDGNEIGPLGLTNIVAPVGGTTTTVVLPFSFPGASIIMQGVVATPIAPNGIFVATNGTNINIT